MAKLFFLLSGEHDTLPISELKSIVEAGGYRYKVVEILDQALRIEADSECIDTIEKKSAFTKMCGLEVLNCEADVNEIVSSVRVANFEKVLRNGESFVVRLRRVKEYSQAINGMALENRIGNLLLNKVNKAKVNLRNPDKTFIGILTSGKFLFGLKIAEISPKPFMERRPKRKPFFHPSAMHAKLSRCMVNLTKPKNGELVFDPFCGTGSTLIEALLIGCEALGMDIQRRMARGTRRNLEYFDLKSGDVIVGDSRRLPIKKVDCVVTDPPYGRSATTLKRTTKQIIEEVLEAVSDVLHKGNRICMAAPKTLAIGSIGESRGYKHLESHFVYVHRSLTREIAVFEKR